MALDRARLKQRLATALLDERARRGGGDARRFPQPEMARLLDYSLRQYQRLENAEDPSLPDWSDLERISEVLGFDYAELFGDTNQEAAVPVNGEMASPAELAELRAEVAEVRALAERILSRLEKPPRASSRAR